MKNKLWILLMAMFILPLRVFASGGFSVSNTSITMYPGETKTISVTSNNAVGKLNVSSSNGNIASVSPSSIFIQNPGSSGDITITSKSVGTAYISVEATSNFATMDEEVLTGVTRTITVNVVEKPKEEPKQEEKQPESKPETKQEEKKEQKQEQPKTDKAKTEQKKTEPTNNENLSKNNNLKEISVDGYEIIKVDNNNYTLAVGNSISSITINATAEDSKAKVSGTGSKELVIGENKIEIIVTSESGAKNKILLTVTRKDAYYLEDLESAIKDIGSDEIDLVINSDSKLTIEDVNKIKESKKKVNLSFTNETGKVLYIWTIDGNNIKDSKELLTTVLNTSDNIDKINSLSNYPNGLIIKVCNDGEIISGAKLKYYVGDDFTNGEILNIYYYDKDNNKMVLVSNVTVKDGYAEFDVTKNDEYLITKSDLSKLDNTDSSSKSKFNVFMFISIIEFDVIVVWAIITILKKRKNKKNTEVTEVLNNNSY